MAKWHPASGKWGPLGETQGSKQARRNKKSIDEMTSTLENRRPQIGQFYSEMGDINERVRENRRLTELDKFLNSSYDIRQESDRRVARTNFATITDVEAKRKMDRMNTQKKRADEMFGLQSTLDEIKLGREEKKELNTLDDLINQLRIERGRY
tara:strand:- start:6212 stop:6670 length:459 start_codon:yes stop_codon:yes gene_type:complete